MQGMQPYPLGNVFGLNLGKIWTNLDKRTNLVKSDKDLGKFD